MNATARMAYGLNVDSQKDKNNIFVTTANKVMDTFTDSNNPIVLLFRKYQKYS